jgi:hypothetical protein
MSFNSLFKNSLAEYVFNILSDFFSYIVHTRLVNNIGLN